MTSSAFKTLESAKCHQVYAFTGDSASNNISMLAELEARWNLRYENVPNAWNPAVTYTACIAHIIHNSVLAFLEAMSSDPPNTVDIYDKDDELRKSKKRGDKDLVKIEA